MKKGNHTLKTILKNEIPRPYVWEKKDDRHKSPSINLIEGIKFHVLNDLSIRYLGVDLIHEALNDKT